MKRLVAALLVLTMVLALTGTAMADCKFKDGDIAKFVKNAVAYTGPHNYNDTSTIVRKGSWAEVICVKGDWIKLRLVPKEVYVDGVPLPNDRIPTAWFKSSDLKVIPPRMWRVYVNGVQVAQSRYHVVFCQGGKDMSWPIPNAIIGNIEMDKCHVKATAKVWVRKTHALRQNTGKALHDGDVVKFRHQIGFDTRLIPFYSIRYEGKCRWVSSEYSKLVK
jgi:hypothetical protein